LKKAEPHTIGIGIDVKRLKTRQNAEEQVVQQVTLGQTLLCSAIRTWSCIGCKRSQEPRR